MSNEQINLKCTLLEKKKVHPYSEKELCFSFSVNCEIKQKENKNNLREHKSHGETIG